MSLSKKFMMLEVKMNDEKTVKRTARPAGESKEKRRNSVKVNSFTFHRNFLNETRLGKWDSCVNSRSRWRLLTHSAVHQSTDRARGRNGSERRERNIYFRNTNFIFREAFLFLLFIHKLDRKSTKPVVLGFTHGPL